MPKKTFTDSIPAELFIEDSKKPEEPQSTKAEPATKEKAPEGYYLSPEYVEAKSRRVQVLVKPSLYTKGKAIAEERGVSFNELINILLEEL